MKKRFRQADSNVQWLLPLEYDVIKQSRSEELLAGDGIFRADEELTEECINSPDALIWLVMQEPLKPMETCTPASVMKASMDTIEERDDLRKKFLDVFEPSLGDEVLSEEVSTRLGMTSHGDKIKLNGRMKAWGYGGAVTKRCGVRTLRVYVGIKRKMRDERGGPGGERD